jgi:hypothetical protein
MGLNATTATRGGGNGRVMGTEICFCRQIDVSLSHNFQLIMIVIMPHGKVAMQRVTSFVNSPHPFHQGKKSEPST